MGFYNIVAFRLVRTAKILIHWVFCIVVDFGSVLKVSNFAQAKLGVFVGFEAKLEDKNLTFD